MKRTRVDLATLEVKTLNRKTAIGFGLRSRRLNAKSVAESHAYLSAARSMNPVLAHRIKAEHNPVLTKGIGDWFRRGRSQEAFDPNAIDGDGDGIIQDHTPFERPAIARTPQRGGLVDRVRRVFRGGEKPQGTARWDDPQYSGMTRQQRRMAMAYSNSVGNRRLTRKERRLLEQGVMPNRRNLRSSGSAITMPNDGMTRRERRLARSEERMRLMLEGISSPDGRNLSRRERRLIREGKLPADYGDPKYEGLTRRERRLARAGKLPIGGPSRRQRRQTRDRLAAGAYRNRGRGGRTRIWRKRPESEAQAASRRTRSARREATEMAGVGTPRKPRGGQVGSMGPATPEMRVAKRVNDWANRQQEKIRADQRWLWAVSSPSERGVMEDAALRRGIREFNREKKRSGLGDLGSNVADILDFGLFDGRTDDPALKAKFDAVDTSEWSPEMQQIWADLTNWVDGEHKPRRGFVGWPDGGRPDDPMGEIDETPDTSEFEQILNYRIDLNNQRRRPRTGGLGRPDEQADGPSPGGGGRPTPGGGAPGGGRRPRPRDPRDYGPIPPRWPTGEEGPTPGGRGPRPTPKPETDFFSEDFDMDPATIKDIYDVEYLEDLLQRIRAEERATGERRPELKEEISNQISDINWYEKHKSKLLKGVAFEDVREIRKEHNKMFTAQKKGAEARRKRDNAEEVRQAAIEVQAKRKRDQLIEDSIKRNKARRFGEPDAPKEPTPGSKPKPKPGPTPGGGDGPGRTPSSIDLNDESIAIADRISHGESLLAKQDEKIKKLQQDRSDLRSDPEAQAAITKDLRKAMRDRRALQKQVDDLKKRRDGGTATRPPGKKPSPATEAAEAVEDVADTVAKPDVPTKDTFTPKYAPEPKDWRKSPYPDSKKPKSGGKIKQDIAGTTNIDNLDNIQDDIDHAISRAEADLYNREMELHTLSGDPKSADYKAQEQVVNIAKRNLDQLKSAEEALKEKRRDLAKRETEQGLANVRAALAEAKTRDDLEAARELMRQRWADGLTDEEMQQIGDEIALAAIEIARAERPDSGKKTPAQRINAWRNDLQQANTPEEIEALYKELSDAWADEDHKEGSVVEALLEDLREKRDRLYPGGYEKQGEKTPEAEAKAPEPRAPEPRAPRPEQVNPPEEKPAPKPEPKPAPRPKPEPKPAPKPEPKPAPKPEPKPAPAPRPAPAPKPPSKPKAPPPIPTGSKEIDPILGEAAKERPPIDKEFTRRLESSSSETLDAMQKRANAIKGDIALALLRVAQRNDDDDLPDGFDARVAMQTLREYDEHIRKLNRALTEELRKRRGSFPSR